LPNLRFKVGVEKSLCSLPFLQSNFPSFEKTLGFINSNVVQEYKYKIRFFVKCKFETQSRIFPFSFRIETKNFQQIFKSIKQDFCNFQTIQSSSTLRFSRKELLSTANMKYKMLFFSEYKRQQFISNYRFKPICARLSFLIVQHIFKGFSALASSRTNGLS